MKKHALLQEAGKLHNRMFRWKYRPLGAALIQAFCGQQVRTEVLETLSMKKGGMKVAQSWQHCFLPASAPFWRPLTENDYHKIKIILAGSFSKNYCIHVKSQKASVLQSLKQLKSLLTSLNFHLFCNLHSHDQQNNAVPSPIEPWFGPCDWYVHYLGLSYCAFLIVKLVCCQNCVDRKCHCIDSQREQSDSAEKTNATY